MTTPTPSAAPESLLAAPDQASQQQISDEVRAAHAARGEDAPRPLHAFAPSRSSVPRHPTRTPRPVGPETIELHSPAFGQRDVAAIESDLTIQHAGEPLGERITV